jgi:hypothetical protein
MMAAYKLNATEKQVHDIYMLHGEEDSCKNANDIQMWMSQLKKIILSTCFHF